MADPFIGEIRLFAGNFSPRGFAFCNGQSLSIAQNRTLYSIIGVTYGGDGQQSFNLPNLSGRAAMHPGQGAGLSNRTLGESGGLTHVALTMNQLPAHTHTAGAYNGVGNENDPTGAVWAGATGRSAIPMYAPSADTAMAGGALLPTGTISPAAHNNVQPYQAVNFIIALWGEWPQRP